MKLTRNRLTLYLLKPFAKLRKIIAVYSQKHNRKRLLEEPSGEVQEFKQLESDVQSGFKTNKTQSLSEQDISRLTRHYANEISNPVHSIKMLVNDIDEVPIEKRKLIIKAANQIHSKTNELLESLKKTHPIEPYHIPYKDTTPIILIDDSKALTMTWELDASNAGINLIVYNDAEKFKVDSKDLNKDSTIYMDINLRQNYTGVELSKWAFKKGFKTIYLITADDPSEYSHLKQVKGVRGKTPPFLNKKDNE